MLTRRCRRFRSRPSPRSSLVEALLHALTIPWPVPETSEARRRRILHRNGRPAQHPGDSSGRGHPGRRCDGGQEGDLDVLSSKASAWTASPRCGAGWTLTDGVLDRIGGPVASSRRPDLGREHYRGASTPARHRGNDRAGWCAGRQDAVLLVARSPGGRGPGESGTAGAGGGGSDELEAISVGITPPPGPDSTTLVGLPTWMWVADPGPQTWGPITRTASSGSVTVTATGRSRRWCGTWVMARRCRVGRGLRMRCGVMLTRLLTVGTDTRLPGSTR